MNFSTSTHLHDATEKVLATGISSGLRCHVTPTPLYFDRGEGPYVYGADAHWLLDFLESLLKLCRRHGIVSIFNEVVTGFRIALGGARGYYGLIPDLSVYGKALASGFSLSAMGGRVEIFDVLRDGRTFHAGAYNGNAICLAAAQATRKMRADPGVFSRLCSHGADMQDGHRGSKTLLATTDDFRSRLCINRSWGLEEAPANYRDTLRANAAQHRRFQLPMLDNSVYLLPESRWYVGAAHDAAMKIAA